MKNIFSKVVCLISILILLTSVLLALIMPTNSPYINSSSIKYELAFAKDSSENVIYDEQGNFVYNVAAIEIEIVNSSSKRFENVELVLRYCREDRYPEAYTSPIIISINPFEKKTITIENFRNTCRYDEKYHLESDVNKDFYIEVKNYGNEIEILKASFITLPIAFISTVISVIGLSINSKKNKEV